MCSNVGDRSLGSMGIGTPTRARFLELTVPRTNNSSHGELCVRGCLGMCGFSLEMAGLRNAMLRNGNLEMNCGIVVGDE